MANKQITPPQKNPKTETKQKPSPKQKQNKKSHSKSKLPQKVVTVLDCEPHQKQNYQDQD